MKIVLAGGTGYLGTVLKKYFESLSMEVITLSRKRTLSNKQIHWDGKTPTSELQTCINSCDVLINLAGKSVDCRYTEANREKILQSRIDSTSLLHQLVSDSKTPPKVWLNASSATIYTHSETNINTEENGIIGDDFSMGICKSWEKAFYKKEVENVRKISLRTSIVLGNSGGAFPKMKMITRLLFGGHQGRGKQYISWIHESDFCRAIIFLIEGNLEGSVNITAPNPIQNKSFMKLLRTKMNSPFGISQPVWMLEIGATVIGTETELLLKSRNVFPKRLIDSGFTFAYEYIDQAMENLLI